MPAKEMDLTEKSTIVLARNNRLDKVLVERRIAEVVGGYVSDDAGEITEQVSMRLSSLGKRRTNSSFDHFFG